MNYLKYLWLIIKNWEHYKFWRTRKKGTKTVDYTRGAGYYISAGILFHDPRGKREEHKMQSGKTGIYELIDYTTFSDPHDMIKHSEWMFVGYKGQKPINDCTFTEFLNNYT